MIIIFIVELTTINMKEIMKMFAPMLWEERRQHWSLHSSSHRSAGLQAHNIDDGDNHDEDIDDDHDDNIDDNHEQMVIMTTIMMALILMISPIYGSHFHIFNQKDKSNKIILMFSPIYGSQAQTRFSVALVMDTIGQPAENI